MGLAWTFFEQFVLASACSDLDILNDRMLSEAPLMLQPFEPPSGLTVVKTM
jgi:hypothetical protein